MHKTRYDVNLQWQYSVVSYYYRYWSCVHMYRLDHLNSFSECTMAVLRLYKYSQWMELRQSSSLCMITAAVIAVGVVLLGVLVSTPNRDWSKTIIYHKSRLYYLWFSICSGANWYPLVVWTQRVRICTEPFSQHNVWLLSSYIANKHWMLSA